MPQMCDVGTTPFVLEFLPFRLEIGIVRGWQCPERRMQHVQHEETESRCENERGIRRVGNASFP